MVVVFSAGSQHQIRYLKPLFAQPVGLTVPTPRPDEFIVVEDDGGSALSPAHDKPMVTYRATAKTIGRAADLIALVRAHVRAQEGFLNDIGGPVFLPDPDDKLPRYQYTAQIRLRGVEQ